MAVTHIIRGEDHISNTPRQILIQEAIGAPKPYYAHIPLILDKDRAKLSKRKHGEGVSLSYYIKKGYLPQAVVNFLSLLGWNPGTPQEIFTPGELVKQFNIEKVQKGGAVFNVEKLNWINKEHLKLLPTDKINEAIYKEINKFHVADIGFVQKLSPIILERISTFGDVAELIKVGELEYFFNKPNYEIGQLKWKGDSDIEVTKKHLSHIISAAGEIADDEFSADGVKKALFGYAEQQGKGSVLWPLRYALSGKDKSPDPFNLMEVLGKKETIERLKIALRKLQ